MSLSSYGSISQTKCSNSCSESLYSLVLSFCKFLAPRFTHFLQATEPQFSCHNLLPLFLNVLLHFRRKGLTITRPPTIFANSTSKFSRWLFSYLLCKKKYCDRVNQTWNGDATFLHVLWYAPHEQEPLRHNQCQ